MQVPSYDAGGIMYDDPTAPTPETMKQFAQVCRKCAQSCEKMAAAGV